MSLKVRAVIAITAAVLFIGTIISFGFATDGAMEKLDGEIVTGFWPVFRYSLFVMTPVVFGGSALIIAASYGLIAWVFRGENK
jgi:hypothetical protein